MSRNFDFLKPPQAFPPYFFPYLLAFFIHNIPCSHRIGTHIFMTCFPALFLIFLFFLFVCLFVCFFCSLSPSIMLLCVCFGPSQGTNRTTARRTAKTSPSQSMVLTLPTANPTGRALVELLMGSTCLVALSCSWQCISSSSRLSVADRSLRYYLGHD
jgi:hypothetical protein